MPIVALKRDHLFKAIGHHYADDEFNDLCFEFGLELDDITSEREMLANEQGCFQNTLSLEQASDEVVYKIEIPSNRYDLLCIEGLCLAFQFFHRKSNNECLSGHPLYKLLPYSQKSRVMIDVCCDLVDNVRPYICAAVLRNISFTPEVFASFIDYQDKLHNSIGRKRSVVAIGTHDLDSLPNSSGHYSLNYTAKSPKDISFIALNQTNELTADELFTSYETTGSYLKPYVALVRSKPACPVLYESTSDCILSLPPVINGNHTKISLTTKNILIEITSTNQQAGFTALNCITCLFSSYCSPPHCIEAVDVNFVRSSNTSVISFPTLHTAEHTIPISEVSKLIGVDLTKQEVCYYLQKMGYTIREVVTNAEETLITVRVSIIRSDILHLCDIIEDIAIAYGYNRIPLSYPQVVTQAKQFDLNKVSELLRYEVCFCAYTEALTFTLCSESDASSKMCRNKLPSNVCRISNPKTQEFQVCRNSLLPGLLKTVSCNKAASLPIKFFEISDIVLKVTNGSQDIAVNQRNLCAVFCDKVSEFQKIHGLLDRIMQVLGISTFNNENTKFPQYKLLGASSSSSQSNENQDEKDLVKSFLEKRYAKIQLITSSTVDSKSLYEVGHIGVLSPDVVKNFEFSLPCCILEMNLQLLLSLINAVS